MNAADIDELDEQIAAFQLAHHRVRMCRLELVTLSVASLGLNPVWTDLGDTGRRRLARRMQFQRWRLAELYAPFDRLGNRVECQPMTTRVIAISSVLPELLEWAGVDPETRMPEDTLLAFLDVLVACRTVQDAAERVRVAAFPERETGVSL